MPPTLDLGRATHTKVMVSPPRINLRRAASYNHDKGPLSSTSSRFNFDHLVFSPPPSPGLPSLSPPLKKPPKGLKGFMRRPPRAVRLLIWMCGALVVFYFLNSAIRPRRAIPALSWPVLQSSDKYELVAQDQLPDFPTPIVVTDRKGKAKWSVSIPPGSDFPLTMRQYSDICAACREVSERVKALRSQSGSLPQPHLFGSGPTDENFLDVQEAEDAGLLSGSMGRSRRKSGGGKQGHEHSAVRASARGGPVEKQVCSSSMTFVLESSDAGLGKSLMMLWAAYALAKQEGRAFFIDDTRWAYGKFTDIFEPAPVPACRAPPRHEILPCPRQARHLVASATTAQDLFGESFTSLTDDLDEPSLLDKSIRQTVFGLAREGYEALFKLNKEDAEYVDARVRELASKRIVPKSKGSRQDGMVVGVHVRHGDRHPLEFQYQDSYIPLTTYADMARTLLDAHLKDASGSGHHDGAAKEVSAEIRQHSFVLLASDDPLVYEADEFSETGGSFAVLRAQDRIKLATKAAIQQAEVAPPDKHVMRKYVDETFGWDGGFFAAMFWNLGLSSLGSSGASAAMAASSPHDHQHQNQHQNQHQHQHGYHPAAVVLPPPPSAETLRLRSLVGRAYLMDIAVLADASDAVVCTVSAMGCRLLAVMMGWESAVERGNWVNVDRAYRSSWGS